MRLTVGDKGYLRSSAAFEDGKTIDLTRSVQVSFESSAPGVATVDHQGIVTPVSPGSAKITVTYRSSSAEIPVTVLPKRQ